MQSAEVVPTVPDPLVQAKLMVPSVRSGTVARSGLAGHLASAPPALVAVSAPAGYGKTTVMVEWVRQAITKVAWVSLDRGDDEPTALLSLVATAIQGVRPVDPAVFDDLAAPGVSVLGQVVPRLAASLRRSAEPFLLVIDDLHEINDQECRDALNLLVDHLPPGSTLAATSRNEVWLDLGRRRPRGDLLEIGPTQLAFDVDEATQLLARVGVVASGGLAADLVRRTEGWPAGLYMAALVLRDGTRSSDPPEPFGGDDRYVASYLHAEILDRQPADVRRFLARTAVLDQLCGSLCDRVLGSSRSAAMLTTLEKSNLFLVPLDHHSEWYRYHSLFRDVLRTELTTAEPRLVPELHRRAADWYEAHGQPEAAIDHARAAGETERAARLIAECTLSAYASGQLNTAERWIAGLTDEEIEFHPSLAVLAGLLCALTGRPIDAARWADAAEQISNTTDSPDQSRSLESVLAILRALMCAHGVASMVTDATFAVAHEPHWSPWRGSALLTLFSACRLVGDSDNADTVFAEWIETAEAVDDTTLAYALTQRSLAALRRGDWERAAADLERARKRITELKRQDYLESLLTFAASARLAVHHQDLATAQAHLTHAMRLRHLVTWAVPFAAVELRLELTQVCLGLAEPAGARTLLGEIDQIFHYRPDLGTLHSEVEGLREQLSGIPMGAPTPSALTAAELRLLPYLQTHLMHKEIAQRLYVSTNTVKTQAGAIYRKLDVSSRADAVERARQLGLLAG
jgi:LuxR family maltose regulon positive regulatory protein